MEKTAQKGDNYMAQKQDVLFSFVGNRDPYVEDSYEYGPVLSLLQACSYSRVFLFCTGPEYFERARSVENIAQKINGSCKFSFISLELESVIDYEEIFTRLKETVTTVIESIKNLDPEISVLLDPGTPQMQTVWFLLAKSGFLHARLLQGIPPRFAQGIYRVKEVDLDSSVLPSISIPAEQKTGQERKWFTPVTTAGIIGEASVFKNALEKALQYASYDVSVLIRGETGTGKGLLAKFIHDNSERKGNPFQPVNCSSISANLVESEFFGHVKGAFTGAEQDRVGKFRAADTGTIFLDEVGDLPLDMQPKLLKVLEDKRLQPVGADKEIEADIRIIAATNKNLEEMIEKNLFRRDLYERLNQVTLIVPPLKDRQEDIPLLTRAFVEEWNRKYGEAKGLSEETMKYLFEYTWPGNVRELQNAVITLCSTGKSDSIGPDLMPGAILDYFHKKRSVANLEVSIPEEGIELKAFLYNIEKDFYQEALALCNGNREKAARILGINPPAFRKALRERFNLDSSDNEDEG